MHLDPALHPSKMTGDEQFIFALHPHGVLADYRILLDSVIPESFPKVGVVVTPGGWCKPFRGDCPP